MISATREIPLFPVSVQEYDLRPYYDIDTMWSQLEKIMIENDGEYALFPDTHSSYSYEKNIIRKFPRELQLNMMGAINAYAKSCGFKRQAYAESWFNVGMYGAETSPHKHSGCILSATFYPIFEEGSSNLVVERQLHPDMRPPDQFTSAHGGVDTDYNIIEYEIPIKEGHIYVWPSWLRHKCYMNESNRRVMVGINTLNKKVRND